MAVASLLPGTCATASAAPSTRRTATAWRGQFGALGLVLNAIVLWTTKYIDAAVAQLRAEGHELRDEDIARLSPLKHGNLNVLGRYSFTASTPVAGALRPLRDPDAAGSGSTRSRALRNINVRASTTPVLARMFLNLTVRATAAPGHTLGAPALSHTALYSTSVFSRDTWSSRAVVACR